MNTGQTHVNNIFGEMDDPRVDRGKFHSMEKILFISMAAVLCGAESWVEIELFGQRKAEWISKHVDISEGVPSHDTFNRFFSMIDPTEFEKRFRSWVSSVMPNAPELIHIDGKTITGSAGFQRSPLHMVSAWSSDQGMALGQIKTEEKSNEITAIPELLESLLITGAIITIDAMGCQREIVDKIIYKDADYVIAVKGNQRKLYTNIIESFSLLPAFDEFEDTDFGHGRIETRKVSTIIDTSLIDNARRWNSLKAIIRVESEVTHKTSGEVTTSVRYYITSAAKTAQEFGTIIRSHWSIENNLHWMLDVSFGEDGWCKRNANAVQNWNVFNKVAMRLLKNDSTKAGAKSKRIALGWDDKHLEKILGL